MPASALPGSLVAEIEAQQSKFSPCQPLRVGSFIDSGPCRYYMPQDLRPVHDDASSRLLDGQRALGSQHNFFCSTSVGSIEPVTCAGDANASESESRDTGAK